MQTINFDVPDDKLQKILDAFKVKTIEELKAKIKFYIIDTVKAYQQEQVMKQINDSYRVQQDTLAQTLNSIQEDTNLIQ